MRGWLYRQHDHYTVCYRDTQKTLIMEKPLTGKRPTFHQDKPHLNTYRIMLWLVLIVAALGFMLASQRGQIKPLFEPTPPPDSVQVSVHVTVALCAGEAST